MKNNILILCALLGISSLVYAQEDIQVNKVMPVAEVQGMNIDTLFISIPDHLLFGVEKDQRILLTIEADDTTKVEGKNLFGDMIERTAMSRDFIALKTSEAGSVQIKLLTLVNNSQIICVVKTVCAQMCDSRVLFYTDRWVPISSENVFPDFSLDWYRKAGVDINSQGYKNALATLNLYPIHVSLSPDNTDVKIGFEAKKYLSEEEYKLVSPYFDQKEKVLKWDKSSFK